MGVGSIRPPLAGLVAFSLKFKLHSPRRYPFRPFPDVKFSNFKFRSEHLPTTSALSTSTLTISFNSASILVWCNPAGRCLYRLHSLDLHFTMDNKSVSSPHRLSLKA